MSMLKVGKREFKNQQARYLRAVERGATVEITDRGEVVAIVTPPASQKTKKKPARKKVPGLTIRPPQTTRGDPFPANLRNDLPVELVRQWHEEDREDRT